jgi:phage gpG-like protein
MANFQQYKTRIRQALDRIVAIAAVEIEQETKENFIKQGYDGEPWAQVQRRDPNSAVYQRLRRRQSRRTTEAILVDTGVLLNSIQARRTAPRTITLSFEDYGKYHQEGGKNLPRRRWYGLTRALRRRLSRIIRREMDKALQ